MQEEGLSRRMGEPRAKKNPEPRDQKALVRSREEEANRHEYAGRSAGPTSGNQELEKHMSTSGWLSGAKGNYPWFPWKADARCGCLPGGVQNFSHFGLAERRRAACEEFSGGANTVRGSIIAVTAILPSRF